MEKLDLLKMVNDRLKEEREKSKTQSITSENNTSLKGEWEDVEPLENQTLSKDSLSSENDTSLKGDWEDATLPPVEEPKLSKTEEPSEPAKNEAEYKQRLKTDNPYREMDYGNMPGDEVTPKLSAQEQFDMINTVMVPNILKESGYKPDDKIGKYTAKELAVRAAELKLKGMVGLPVVVDEYSFGAVNKTASAIDSIVETVMGKGNIKDSFNNSQKELITLKNMMEIADPKAAFAGKVVGAVTSPSVALKGIQALGKGLKVGEGYLKSTAKVATAAAGDAALSTLGTSDLSELSVSDVAAGAGLGAVGGAFVGGVAAPAVSALITKLPESIVKRFTDKDQVAGDFVLEKLAKLADKDIDTVKAAFSSAKDTQEAFATLGVDQNDAVKYIKQLSKVTSGDGKLFGEIQTTAKGKAEKNESTIRQGVKDYTDSNTKEAINQTFGKEVGKQYKAVTGSDLESAISKIKKLSSSDAIMPELRKTILERLKLDKNIYANTGRKSFNEIKPEDIIITDSGKVLMPKKDAGKVLMPKKDAVKLTGKALKKTPNEFGYKKEDLVDLLDNNSLNGEILQSVISKISNDTRMKEGQAYDNATSSLIRDTALKDTKEIVKPSSSDLEIALNSQNTKLSEVDMFETTQSFINKKDLTNTDISEFTANINKLSEQSAESADKRKAVTMALKDFYSVEQKGSGIIDNFGKVNPNFEKALIDNGMDKKDFDDISTIIRESNLLREFNKSTGPVSPEETAVTKSITGFATRLFFMEPINAFKSTMLSLVGREFVEGMQKTRKESYSNFVKQIASLDNSDFEKIKKIASTKKVSLHSAATLYLSKAGAKVASRYAGDNSDKVEPDQTEATTE